VPKLLAPELESSGKKRNSGRLAYRSHSTGICLLKVDLATFKRVCRRGLTQVDGLLAPHLPGRVDPLRSVNWATD
jgi:hypothetical protein